MFMKSIFCVFHIIALFALYRRTQLFAVFIFLSCPIDTNENNPNLDYMRISAHMPEPNSNAECFLTCEKTEISPIFSSFFIPNDFQTTQHSFVLYQISDMIVLSKRNEYTQSWYTIFDNSICTTTTTKLHEFPQCVDTWTKSFDVKTQRYWPIPSFHRWLSRQVTRESELSRNVYVERVEV